MRNKMGTLGNTDEHSAFVHREWRATIIRAAAGCSCTYVRHICHSQLMCLPSTQLGLRTTSLVRQGRRGPPKSLRPVLSSGRCSKLSLIASWNSCRRQPTYSFPFVVQHPLTSQRDPLHLSLGKMAQRTTP